MTQHTFNIIYLSKLSVNKSLDEFQTDLKTYLSMVMYIDKDYFTDFKLNEVMFNALCDYIDTCNKPSEILKALTNMYSNDWHNVLTIRQVFININCKDNFHNWINGFSEELYKEGKKCLTELMIMEK